MISFQPSRPGCVQSAATTRCRGASRSVRSQNVSPSLPMKSYCASQPVIQVDHLGIGLCQVEIEQLVLAISVPRHDADHQPVAVVGHFTIKAPFLFVGPLVDQLVVRLRRAEPVEVQLLKIVDAGQLGFFSSGSS